MFTRSDIYVLKTKRYFQGPEGNVNQMSCTYEIFIRSCADFLNRTCKRYIPLTLVQKEGFLRGLTKSFPTLRAQGVVRKLLVKLKPKAYTVGIVGQWNSEDWILHKIPS
jgi:hypothetical protein